MIISGPTHLNFGDGKMKSDFRLKLKAIIIIISFHFIESKTYNQVIYAIKFLQFSLSNLLNQREAIFVMKWKIHCLFQQNKKLILIHHTRLSIPIVIFFSTIFHIPLR